MPSWLPSRMTYSSRSPNELNCPEIHFCPGTKGSNVIGAFGKPRTRNGPRSSVEGEAGPAFESRAGINFEAAHVREIVHHKWHALGRVDRIPPARLSHFNPVVAIAGRGDVAAGHQTAFALHRILGVLDRDLRSDFKIAGVETQTSTGTVGDGKIIEESRLKRILVEDQSIGRAVLRREAVDKQVGSVHKHERRIAERDVSQMWR